MRLSLLFTLGIWVPQAFAVQIKICGFTPEWLAQNSSFEGRLSAQELANPRLEFSLTPLPWQSLAESPVFQTSVPSSEGSKFWEFTLRQARAYLPVLERYIAVSRNRLASFKLSPHAITSAKLDSPSRCLFVDALSLSKNSGEVFLGGDSDLWRKLSETQKSSYLLAKLLEENLSRPKLKLSNEPFSLIPTALIDLTGMENFYQRLLGSRQKIFWEDIHPLFDPRDLDAGMGRKTRLDDWIYSFTPWISQSDSSKLSDRDFSDQLEKQVQLRCLREWKEYFPHLTDDETKSFCQKISQIFSTKTLTWLRNFQRSGTNPDEFLNPYTVNSFWRGYLYPELTKVVFENSRFFPIQDKFK